MEQSNLLELAKQGEPTAIAALMNAVLEPTGIMAQAKWETDCLWITLESPKALNQETLITFIHRGLLELGNASIRSVKVQGKKKGEDSFSWLREFEVYPHPPKTDPVETEGAERREVVSAASGNPIDHTLLAAGTVALKVKPEPTVQENQPVLEATSLRSTDPNPAEDTPDLEITSLSSLEKLLEVNEVKPELTPAGLDRESIAIASDPSTSDPSETVTQQTSPEAVATIEPDLLRDTHPSESKDSTLETEPVREEEPEAEELESASTLRGWLKTYWQIYSLPVLLVVITGFVLGSAVAFWSTAQQQDNLVPPQEDTLDHKQKEAEAYLKAMNSAQQSFYQKNNRFATSLEELERSANLISQSYSYAYQIKVSDRALITALPRESGLKSYVGAVFVLPTGTKSLICQTIKPSMQAPTAPLFSKKKVAACAPRSIKVQ